MGIVNLALGIGWLWLWGRGLFSGWDENDTFTKLMLCGFLILGFIWAAGGAYLLVR